MQRWLGSMLAPLLVLGSISPAFADEDAEARVLAQQLFDEAEKLHDEKRFADACPKYAESYRLDPQLGVLIYLGECYESNGQLASAWATFHQAEEMAQARGDQRLSQARARVASLEPRLSRLNISVPQSARVTGLSVYRNGMALAPVAWGVSTPTDGGDYLIQASAPGRKSWSFSVTVAPEAGNVSVMVPELESLPSDLLPLAPPPSEPTPASTPAAPPSPAVRPVRVAPPASAPVVPTPASPNDVGRSRRITALAVGGLGIVGLGVGGVLGVSANSSFDDSAAFCNDGGYCTPRGSSLRDSAQSKALASTVVTGVGAAALITGIVLWVTAPNDGSEHADHARAATWSVVPATSGWGLGAHHAF